MIQLDAPKTKKNLIYETLKARIVRNEFRPLEYLNEKELAYQMGTSKTPIREALQELGRNRFVTIIPNKGCFVTNISLEDIREIFELRQIYECAAVRVAAQRQGNGELVALLKQYEENVGKESNSVQERLLAGYQIHSAIVQAMGNSRLYEAYANLQDHIVRVRIYFMQRYLHHRVTESEEEHRAIIEAILKGDPEGAEEALREHLAHALEFIRQHI